MLIPGLFTLLEKVIGPLLTSESKTSITGKIFGMAASLSSGGILTAIESVVGNIESQQRIELQAQIQTLLGQCTVDQIEANSDTFFKYGWRPFLAWGLSVLVIIHLTIAEIANVLHMIGYSPGSIAPMDTLTTTLIFGLLGLYMSARTIEKVNTNHLDE